MFGAKPLMKENVIGQPPSGGRLKKKIFGAMPQGKAAAPFGAAPSGPFGKAQGLNAFGAQSNVQPSSAKSLAKRLTGK